MARRKRSSLSYSASMKRLRSLVACVFGVWFVGATGIGCDDSGGGGSTSSSSSDDCGMSLCGCSSDAIMDFDATVQDATTMMPLAGIELVCFGESTPIAVSDGTGKLNYSIQTRSSPGCGFDRCNNMKLHDPSGAHMDLEGTYYTFNEKTLSL